MRVFVSLRKNVVAYMCLHGRIRARVRLCVCMCEEIKNATLNAGRTIIYCYQLLTSCHARGASDLLCVCSFHILLLHPAPFFVLLWYLSVIHF